MWAALNFSAQNPLPEALAIAGLGPCWCTYCRGHSPSRAPGTPAHIAGTGGGAAPVVLLVPKDSCRPVCPSLGIFPPCGIFYIPHLQLLSSGMGVPLPCRPRKDLPHRCSTHFDAVAQIRGEAFFFKGEPQWHPVGAAHLWPQAPLPEAASPLQSPGKYFWRLTRDRHLVSLQPAQMHRFWRGLPLHLDSVDAVYERTSDHKIVFFKGGWPLLPWDMGLGPAFLPGAAC